MAKHMSSSFLQKMEHLNISPPAMSTLSKDIEQRRLILLEDIEDFCSWIESKYRLILGVHEKLYLRYLVAPNANPRKWQPSETSNGPIVSEDWKYTKPPFTFGELLAKFCRNTLYFTPVAGDDTLDTNMHNLVIAKQSDKVKQCIDDMIHYQPLNTQNAAGQTILHMAVIVDNPDLCRYILVHGASIDVRDRKGENPLHIACRKGYYYCLTELTRCVTYDEVKDLVYEVPFRNAPSTEIRNIEGLTLLHLAVKAGHFDIVYYLVHDLHADVNTREGKRGLTAIMMAVLEKHFQMVMFLCKQCYADLYMRSFDGFSILDMAFGDDNMINLCHVMRNNRPGYNDISEVDK